MVIDNADPLTYGRLRVRCAQLYGTGVSTWLLGCVAPGDTTLPAIGVQVWLGFELGDDDHPIWMGVVTGPWVAAATAGQISGLVLADSSTSGSMT